MYFKELIDLMDTNQRTDFESKTNKYIEENLKDILNTKLKTIYAPILDTKVCTYKTFFAIIKDNKVLFLYPGIVNRTTDIIFGLCKEYPFIYIKLIEKLNSDNSVMIFDYDKEGFLRFCEVFGY